VKAIKDSPLQVVHSRSFGSPGEGGAAVRMLVPLVDFLNHAGDEYQLGGGNALLGSAAGDNVRWDGLTVRLSVCYLPMNSMPGLEVTVASAVSNWMSTAQPLANAPMCPG